MRRQTSWIALAVLPLVAPIGPADAGVSDCAPGNAQSVTSISERNGAGRGHCGVAVPLPAQQTDEGARPMETRLHPGALAELIDELGGRRVSVGKARVIAVLNPRAFLIEPALPFTGLAGNLDRLLVLLEEGELRVDAASMVGSNVTVRGVARTLLGAKVSGEVPWPRELTPQVIKRLEIRAAILARSVQTTDGIELAGRRLSTLPVN